MRRPLAILTISLAAALAPVKLAGAVTFYFSFTGGEPPITNTGGDVGEFEDYPAPGAATRVVFNEQLLTDYPNENVDAFELLPNGNMVISVTDNNASLVANPTITFDDGDLIEFDPVANTVTVIFLESSLNATGDPDVDAVAVLPNGDILLSTLGSHNVPGIGAVENGDIIRWNGTSASLFLDGDSFFGIDVNIDAFDVTAEGNWAFSLENDASIPTFGGLSVENGDVVLWDINANTATIWLDESVLANGPADIDALAVPEPNTAALFALGLLGLGLTGRRRPPR